MCLSAPTVGIYATRSRTQDESYPVTGLPDWRELVKSSNVTMAELLDEIDRLRASGGSGEAPALVDGLLRVLLRALADARTQKNPHDPEVQDYWRAEIRKALGVGEAPAGLTRVDMQALDTILRTNHPYSGSQVCMDLLAKLRVALRGPVGGPRGDCTCHWRGDGHRYADPNCNAEHASPGSVGGEGEH